MRLAIALSVAVLSAAGATAGGAQSIWTRLLANARESYPDFPEGTNVKLTNFSYLGFVESAEGTIHVCVLRSVLTGIPAPRGRDNHVLFFGQDEQYLGRLRIDPAAWFPEPGWCADGKLFFRSRSRLLPTNTGGEVYNGNALDLSDGWANRRMVDVTEHGSSGGWGSMVPTERQRERELRERDSK